VLARIVVWWSAFTMATGATVGYASLLVTRFLFGVGEAGAWPGVARTFSRWIPRAERGRVQGLFFASAHFAGGITPLVVPDTVHVQVPFLATVTTFGGACDHPDGSDVSTRGLFADVTPYVLLPHPETICIALLRASPQSTEVTFAAPGTGVVRVHGRRFDGNAVTLQGVVVVRP